MGGAFTAPTQGSQSFQLVKPEYADASIRRAIAEERLTEDDTALIREYVAEMRASNGIGVARANKITFALVNWRRFIGPYRSNTVADLYQAVHVIKSATSQRGRPFKQNTIRDHIIFLKRIYLWMIENGYSNIPVKKVEKIRAPPEDHNTKLPEHLLSLQEIETMIRACRSSRDRAIIALLYESGCRIGELARLTWERVRFDRYGVVLTVDDTKCSTQRYVRLVLARPYLAAWQADYPFEPVGSALVFLSSHHRILKHGTAMKLLNTTARRAGLNKHITPHIFRHSRITHLIAEGMNESVIKLMMWGNINTKMFATYAHLTGKEIDQEVLRNYGIVPEDGETERPLEAIQCPHCITVNPPGSKYCLRCGLGLGEDAVSAQGLLSKDVLEHPEVMRKLLNELIEEKKRNGEL